MSNDDSDRSGCLKSCGLLIFVVVGHYAMIKLFDALPTPDSTFSGGSSSSDRIYVDEPERTKHR